MRLFRWIIVFGAAHFMLFDSGSKAEGAMAWSQVKFPISQRLQQPPVLTTLKEPVKFSHSDGEMVPFSEYRATARVLARRDYWVGRENKASQTDLVLGWNDLALPENAIKIDFTQMGRFYLFPEESTSQTRHIRNNTANIHVIPANKKIQDALEKVTIGKVVEIKGRLVNYNGTTPLGSSWHWASSKSLQDKGYYSSELVFIDSIKIY